MSGKYNIVAEQGATYNLNFTIETNGVALNLTSYTFAMQVRRSTASNSALINLTSATMNSSGQVAVTIPATTMNNVPAGRFVYDIELTTGTTVTRILEGRFIVTPQVTQ